MSHSVPKGKRFGKPSNAREGRQGAKEVMKVSFCTQRKMFYQERGFKPCFINHVMFKCLKQEDLNKEGLNKVFRYNVSGCVRMCQDREDRE